LVKHRFWEIAVATIEERLRHKNSEEKAGINQSLYLTRARLLKILRE